MPKSMKYMVTKPRLHEKSAKFNLTPDVIEIDTKPSSKRKSIKIDTCSRPLLPTSSKKYDLEILAGKYGIPIRIILFCLTIIADVLLLFVLFKQVKSERNYDEPYYDYKKLAITTVVISTLPLITTNAISFLLYVMQRTDLSDNTILKSKSGIAKIFCIVLHVCHMGILFRYIDVLLATQHHMKRQKETIEPKFERPRDPNVNSLVRKDMENIDVIKISTQEIFQMFFQGYWILRGTELLSIQTENESVIMAQTWRIVLSILNFSWSIACYQDAIRLKFSETPNLGTKALFVTLWRFSEVTSRITAILTFASLRVTEDGGLFKGNLNSIYNPSFPLLAVSYTMIRFILTTVFVHLKNQQTMYKTRPGNTTFQSHFGTSVLVGWLSVFCYINQHSTVKKIHLALFYLLAFVEATILITIMFFQLLTVTLWRKIAVVCITELSLLTSMTCAALFYGFINAQPSHIKIKESKQLIRS